jgi:hypothetical protein
MFAQTEKKLAKALPGASERMMAQRLTPIKANRAQKTLDLKRSDGCLDKERTTITAMKW